MVILEMDVLVVLVLLCAVDGDECVRIPTTACTYILPQPSLTAAAACCDSPRLEWGSSKRGHSIHLPSFHVQV